MTDPVSSRRAACARCLAAAGLTALLLAGCASAPTQTYRGARKAASEVAVLKADASVLILGIDRRKYRGRDFEILPGERHVRFKAILRGEELGLYKNQRAACHNDAKFLAEPGRTYKLVKQKVTDTGSGRAGGEDYISYGFHIRLLDMTDDDVIEGAVGNCEWKQ